MSRDIPILFSAPMVRANLAGTKTQTRRVVKVAHADATFMCLEDGYATFGRHTSQALTERVRNPYGQPGDRLYVREAYSGPYTLTGVPPRDWPKGTPIWYWADGEPTHGDWTKPKPGMHLPRWASRTLLLVKEVRIERLQAISEADAIAEGCAPQQFIRGEDDMMINHVMLHAPWAHRAPGSFLGMPAQVARYVVLWDTINGKTCPWASNPWVWVITYERIKP